MAAPPVPPLRLTLGVLRCLDQCEPGPVAPRYLAPDTIPEEVSLPEKTASNRTKARAILRKKAHQRHRMVQASDEYEACFDNFNLLGKSEPLIAACEASSGMSSQGNASLGDPVGPAGSAGACIRAPSGLSWEYPLSATEMLERTRRICDQDESLARDQAYSIMMVIDRISGQIEAGKGGGENRGGMVSAQQCAEGLASTDGCHDSKPLHECYALVLSKLEQLSRSLPSAPPVPELSLKTAVSSPEALSGAAKCCAGQSAWPCIPSVVSATAQPSASNVEEGPIPHVAKTPCPSTPSSASSAVPTAGESRRVPACFDIGTPRVGNSHNPGSEARASTCSEFSSTKLSTAGTTGVVHAGSLGHSQLPLGVHNSRRRRKSNGSYSGQ